MRPASSSGDPRGASSCVRPCSNSLGTPGIAKSDDHDAILGVESKRVRRENEDPYPPDLEGLIRVRRAASEAEKAQREREVGPYPAHVRRLFRAELHEESLLVFASMR